MSANVIGIFAHSRARPALLRHWDHYQKPGDPFFIVQPTNVSDLSPVPIGHGKYHGLLKMGSEPFRDGENQVIVFLSTLNYILENDDTWEQVCLTEYDGLFFGNVPAVKEPGLMATLAGYRDGDFRGAAYFHAPWVMTRNTAEYMVETGERMLRAGLTERGIVDRWLGLWMDLYDIKHIHSGCYSQNSLDRPQWMEEAREAVRVGAWHIHGVKTEEQFKELTA